MSRSILCRRDAITLVILVVALGLCTVTSGSLSTELDPDSQSTGWINPLLHLVNAGLLLTALRRLGVGPEIGGFVVLCFALHPLQVEALMRADGRGLLLGSTFWMLGMILYAARAHRPSHLLEEIGLILCVLLGSLATPLVLLLPLALLLLDLWPLSRPSFQTALREKLPLLLLSALTGTFLGWISHGSPGPDFASTFPAGLRPGNGILALALSVRDLIWPAALSPLHAQPLHFAPTGIALATTALFAISLGCWHAKGSLRFAWAWYLLLVTPSVIVEGGGMGFRHDAWTSLAVIGPAWALADLLGRHARPLVAVSIAAVILSGLALKMRAQIDVWSDESTRLQYALEIDPTNWNAQSRLAALLAEEGDPAAEDLALASLVQLPRQTRTQLSLATAVEARCDTESALRLYQNVLESGWSDTLAASRLGHVLLRTGHTDAAEELFALALDEGHGSGDAHAGLALGYAWRGDFENARKYCDEALASRPETRHGRLALAWLLATSPDPDIRDAERAMELCPDDPTPDALDIAAAACAARGEFTEAYRLAQEAATKAELAGWPSLAEEIRGRARTYLQRRAWTDRRDSAPAPNAVVEQQSDTEDPG